MLVLLWLQYILYQFLLYGSRLLILFTEESVYQRERLCLSMSTLVYISACFASFMFVLLYLSSMLVVVDRIFAGLGISGDGLPPVDRLIEGLPYRYISLYGWIAVFVSAFLTILTLAPVVTGLGIDNTGFALAFMLIMGLATCLPALKLVRVLKGERVDRWMF